MATITAAMVKDLREKTGAGMMDCKNALNEVGGDIEAAIDWLRKKGLAKAAKKAGRTAAEGLIAVESPGRSAADGRGQFGDRLRRPQRRLPGLRPRGGQDRADDGRNAGGSPGRAFPGLDHHDRR